MVNRWQSFAARLVLLFAASYGLLYFSYKFGMPWSGTGDYSRYYNMYVSPLNLHATQSPFVLRQVSGVLTYLVWKAHIYYPNQIWFQAPGFDQHIFFAALFTNWVFLVLAAATAGVIAEEIAGRPNGMVAVVAGFLCLLSFHTQYVVITGVTEGPSWFLLTVGFLAYLRKMRLALALILMLTIFQRETLLIVFGCIAAFDLIRQRVDVRFRLTIFAWSLACFGVYLGLRRLLPGYEDETHLGYMLSGLRSTHFNGDLLFSRITEPEHYSDFDYFGAGSQRSDDQQRALAPCFAGHIALPRFGWSGVRDRQQYWACRGVAHPHFCGAGSG
jgi:hypothetical protein